MFQLQENAGTINGPLAGIENYDNTFKALGNLHFLLNIIQYHHNKMIIFLSISSQVITRRRLKYGQRLKECFN